jgi:hypothetical protein
LVAGGTSEKIKVSFREAVGLLAPYVKQRLLAQVKSVWVIIVYLILFQTLVLGIGISDASLVASGVALVIVGLAFFLEGLFLGLMPLGELVGLRLPQRAGIAVIVVFATVLGFVATLAEPSIQVLQAAGSSVKAWEAPLLFLLLNRHADLLVWSVGAGVGVAVALGMMRFYYNWSLKPFIYILIGILALCTAISLIDSNILGITGLAWDCGAVTTGPVTVPLVLALGIGISRVAGSAESGSSGFGVVTLASLLPVIAVFALGFYLQGAVPGPMAEKDFFSAANRSKVSILFQNEDAMAWYAVKDAGPEGKKTFFTESGTASSEFLKQLSIDPKRKEALFGQDAKALERWVAAKGSFEERVAVFGDRTGVKDAVSEYGQGVEADLSDPSLYRRNMYAAAKAIVLLIIPILAVLLFIARQRPAYTDEVVMGLLFAVLGMGLFNVGIEVGLGRLGNEIGSKLPSSFRSVQLEDEARVMGDFDPSVVHTSVDEYGKKYSFFFGRIDGKDIPIPYDPKGYDPKEKTYRFVPSKGPLFGKEGGIAGIAVILFFAFVMGYGATLAEPALNALGKTVEDITVGTFRKSLLMQTVAIGVGLGIALGVAKIIWAVSLFWLLIPPYLLLLFLTWVSGEEFVNIAWDSAGVTTGPITVPLVLAMGLGIGNQLGVVEGFGILAMASVCPILTVLLVSIRMERKRATALKEAESSKGGSGDGR